MTPDDLIEHAEQCDWCDADASEYQKLRQAAAQLLAAVEERDRLKAEQERGERVFQAVVYAFEGRTVPDDLKEHGMVRRGRKYREQSDAEVASLKAENERLRGVLNSNGYAAVVENERANRAEQSVRMLTEALVKRMNRCDWCKGKGFVRQNYDDYEVPCSLCCADKAALAAVERGKGEQT